MSIGLFVVLCFSTIAIARTRPRSEILPEFSYCEDMFCFMGIKSGTTSEIDAQTILNNASQLATIANFIDQWASTRSEPANIWLYAKGYPPIVEQITFRFCQPTVDAGEGCGPIWYAMSRVSLVANTELAYAKVFFVFHLNKDRF